MNREAIAVALFNLLSSATIGGQPAFATASRRVELPSANITMPAMFMAEPKELTTRQSQAVPGKVTLEVQVFIYTDARDPNIIPATQVNNILDAIDTAMQPTTPPLISNVQTLGGLVSSCWIEGDTLKAPGNLDGIGLTLVPVKILVPT